MVATVSVLMLVGANAKSLMTNYQMSKHWQAHQKTLTLDYLTPTGLAGQDLVNNTSENQKRFVDLFAQLERSVAAQYINVEHVVPTKNYFLSQHHYAHLYQKSDEYNIVHINQNYLEAMQFPFPKAKLQGNIRTFFVPEAYKAEQQKMTHLIQNSIFEGQSFQDQQHLDVNTVPFNIVYYKANIKVFPYNSNMPSQIKQPIFAFFNQQNMSWSEKELLANTGLNHSPIKITNTHNNLQIIQKVIHQQTGDSRIMPKFSSIGSLVGDQIDSNISSLQILGLILLALLLLNGFSSFFLTTTIIQTKRKILAIQKMHGYKVKDRYRWEMNDRLAYDDPIKASYDDTAMSNLNEIAMLGRELGFYILIGMQRPDAGSLPMAVRNQLNMRINMGVPTPEIEKMVFPDNEKQLRPLSSHLKGWGFIKIGDSQVRSFFAPEVPRDFNLHEYMRENITIRESQG